MGLEGRLRVSAGACGRASQDDRHLPRDLPTSLHELSHRAIGRSRPSRGGRRGPQRGAAVGFVFLPESRMFRSWYTPEAERQAREHLAAMCRDLAIPLINARDWMADDRFVDGFHLTRGVRPSSRGNSVRPSRPYSRRCADDSGPSGTRAIVHPANASEPGRLFGEAPCPSVVGCWVFRHAGRDDRHERGPGNREARSATRSLAIASSASARSSA